MKEILSKFGPKVAVITVLLLAVAFYGGMLVGQGSPKEVVRLATPQSCSAALDDADAVIETLSNGVQVAGEAMGLVPDLIDAIYYQDTATLERVSGEIGQKTTEIEKLTTLLEGQKVDYDANSWACRAAA